MEMSVAGCPLGASRLLEKVRPEFNEEAGLVPISRPSEFPEIVILQRNPGMVEEAVEDGIGAERGLGGE